tara:strand:+ start:1346 stop:1459 length:114 start_codon:yes stop_codon:yes gene_type:complete
MVREALKISFLKYYEGAFCNELKNTKRNIEFKAKENI